MYKLKRFYRPDEVPKPERTVHSLIISGEIPATKIGSVTGTPGNFIKEREEEACNLELESDDYFD